VVALGIVFSAKYNIDSHRFGKYVVAVILGVYLLASGTFRTLYRVAAGWFNQGTTKDDEPD
jgi:surface polysaccharide O-acyltransferase-like enzyme